MVTNNNKTPSEKQVPNHLIRNTLTCLFLVAIILSVYIQTKDFEFTNLDDNNYVFENPYVQQGLTQKSIISAFTTTTGSFWIPLTVLSLMADYEMYNLNAGGYHLTNVFFHILNTLLLFFALKQLTGSFSRSSFAASFFAVHPMFVESVVWISERKDVLSMFFFLLTIIFYNRYARQKNRTNYFFVFILFALGLMAKPMLVTLPFALLLLDYWPLNRLPLNKKYFAKALPPLIIEKMPLFFLSILFSILTFITQNSGTAVIGLKDYSILVRINNAVISYILYLEKFFIPKDLAVFYPHPLNTIPLWQTTISAALLILISYAAIRLSRKYPFFLMGWLWFAGILFPVIGISQSGLQAMADRFIYIPSIGLIIIMTWGITAAVKRLKIKKKIVVSSAFLILFVFSATAWMQTGYWQNNIVLFKHTIGVTENNYIAHTCLANAYFDKGINTLAKEHYIKTLKINPNHAKTYYNLGLLLSKDGQTDAAIKHFNQSLKLRPEMAKAHSALATQLIKKKLLDDAIFHYKEAVRLDPKFINAQNNLGFAYLLKGEYSEAIRIFKTVLKNDPLHQKARNNLNIAIEKSKNSKTN
jgi:tetratricopeptide (TPR) repeat protein